MSKRLSDLLDLPEEVAKASIERFESLSGYESRDIKLLNEMNLLVRRKMSHLHLDPEDTKAKELYHSLICHLEQDIARFERNLQSKHDSKADNFDRLKKLVEHSAVAGEVWALKRSAARQLLRQIPPKKLMRQLGYRSVESMLKRENIDVLYLAIDKVESTGYIKKLGQSYAHLSSKNFENRSVRIVAMRRQCWQKIIGSGPAVSFSHFTGTIAVWPTTNFRAQSLFVQCLQVLQAIEYLRLESVILKLRQAGGDFNKDILELLRAHHATEPHQLAELVGPHLQAEDLKFCEPIEALSRLHPLFRWWIGNHLAALYRSGPVSFSIYDVVNNYLEDNSYERRSVASFQKSLWQNLLTKYLTAEPVEEFLLAHLNDNHWSYEVAPVQPDEKYISVRSLPAAIV